MRKLLVVAGLGLALLLPPVAAPAAAADGCGYGSRCVQTYPTAPTYRRCFRIWRDGHVTRRVCVFPRAQ